MIQPVEFLDGPFDSDETFSLTVIRAAEKIVIGRKNRGFGEGKFVLPGGKDQYYLGNGKIARQKLGFCTVREVMAETGVQIAESSLRQVGDLNVLDEEGEDIQVRIAVAELDQTLPVQDSDELTDVAWWPADNLPYANMPYDYRLWLPHVLQGHYVNVWLETEAGRVVGGQGFWHSADLRQRAAPIEITAEP